MIDLVSVKEIWEIWIYLHPVWHHLSQYIASEYFGKAVFAIQRLTRIKWMQFISYQTPRLHIQSEGHQWLGGIWRQSDQWCNAPSLVFHSIMIMLLLLLLLLLQLPLMLLLLLMMMMIIMITFQKERFSCYCGASTVTDSAPSCLKSPAQNLRVHDKILFIVADGCMTGPLLYIAFIDGDVHGGLRQNTLFDMSIHACHTSIKMIKMSVFKMHRKEVETIDHVWYIE